VFALRLALFTFAGGLAGLAGCLYGFFLGLVPLGSIDITQSERIVIATVLGGTGSTAGALLGTICFVMGADLLSHVWPHWQFALGAIIVMIVFYARGGMWGLVERCAAFVVPLRFRKLPAQ
jgi:branched-chain amino acid transport system permease protein